MPLISGESFFFTHWEAIRRVLVSMAVWIFSWFVIFWVFSFAAYYLDKREVHGDWFFAGMYAAPLLGFILGALVFKKLPLLSDSGTRR
jgi:hypothetical protein